MSTYPYEYTYVQAIPMSTSERLSRLDLEIHEVDRIAVDEDAVSH
jgi:hypothetical protein